MDEEDYYHTDEYVPDRSRTPEDILMYAVFPDFILTDADSSETEQKLNEFHLQVLDFLSPLVKEYIWQHESFDLHPSKVSSSCPCLATSSLASSAGDSSLCLQHLHGSLRYADNIEDEWFAVFLLYEISRRFADVSVRMWDSDGEFLLIEAAYAIPRWLKPENSWNRVFVRHGELHILPLPSNPSEIGLLKPKPLLRDALRVLAKQIVDTRADDSVQACIERRIRDYPEKAMMNMHRTRVSVPVNVAQVLKHEPHLISLAIDAFYDRDVDSMKSAMKMEKFLENKEMVATSVKMSKAMYAQLVQQIFQAPRCYPMPPISSPNFKEAELGMKIACGFEMMYQQRKQYDENMDTTGVSDENTQLKALGNKDVGWVSFKKALENRGYFRGFLEGSKEYRRLLNEALEYYRKSTLFSKVSQVMNSPVKRIDEILSLPYSPSDFDGMKVPMSDDDSWLYNGEEDLNAAMLERQKEIEVYENKRQKQKQSRRLEGKSNTSANTVDNFDPECVARNMHAFVQKMSSYEGAEVPKEGNSESVSLDIKQFIKELKLATGIEIDEKTAHDHNESMDSSDSSSSDMDYDENGSVDDAREQATEVDEMDCTGKDLEGTSDGFMGAYNEALKDQIRNTTLAKSFLHAEECSSECKAQQSVKDEELTPIDVDFNLVQSLIDSFSSQQGLPGPASNLLGLMRLDLPDDSKRRHD
eukprot:TRINITY_DN4124_c0_g1_i1.p1 TRINITY_DN4124_c0_g1~~TRINITY_DN4124_c0_g1_i1.p1  ORF type:complete len:699 (+),score=124.85 TRINITY_DN4124_c0_g1_i1:163-2259(+)